MNSILIGRIMVLLMALSASANSQVLDYLGSTLYSGAVKKIVIEDGFAFCAMGPALVVFSTADPEAPVIEGGCILPAETQDLCISGNHAFLITRESGISEMSIVDISDPATPEVIGSYSDLDYAWNVFSDGNFCYVADGVSGLQIIDISDPTNPVWAANADTGIVMDVYVSGNYAYVAAGIYDLIVLDVSDPRIPQVVASCELNGGAGEILASENIAYMLLSEYPEKYVASIDISDPLNPIPLGQYNPEMNIRDMTLDHNYIYLANGGGISIIDFNNPVDPILSGEYDSDNYISTLDVTGDFALLGWSNIFWGGYEVVDISDPSEIVSLGDYYSPGALSNIVVSENYIYASSNSPALNIVDAGDLSLPVWEGSFQTNESPWDIAVSGQFAYLVNGESGMQIVDVSQPNNPVLTGEYDGFWPDASAREIAVSGDFALVAVAKPAQGEYQQDDGCVEIIDISNPSSPSLAIRITASGMVSNIFVKNDLAFYSWSQHWFDEYWGGIKIMDISNPWAPEVIGSYNTAGGCRLFASGNFLYFGRNSGLSLLDIIDPSNPVYVALCPTPENIFDMTANDNFVYAACIDSGLQIIDVSDPLDPHIVCSYDSPGYNYGVYIVNDYIFLADGTSVIILEFDPFTGVVREIQKPMGISLTQNFPNPFNASTQISFSLPDARQVGLTVYDLLGRRIATLLDEYKRAGAHNIIFDSSDLASGIYIYQLRAGDRTETKRMTLLK